MRSKIIAICLIGFLSLIKHISIFPAIDWEEHQITGVEFKISFNIGKGE